MSELNAEEMAAELSKRGKAWAEADAAYHAYDEATKSVLSECIADIEETMMGHNSHPIKALSVTEKENRARRSLKFKEHLEDKYKARREMNVTRVNFDTYKAYLELRRSEEATTRAAMTLR